MAKGHIWKKSRWVPLYFLLLGKDRKLRGRVPECCSALAPDVPLQHFSCCAPFGIGTGQWSGHLSLWFCVIGSQSREHRGSRVNATFHDAWIVVVKVWDPRWVLTRTRSKALCPDAPWGQNILCLLSRHLKQMKLGERLTLHHQRDSFLPQNQRGQFISWNLCLLPTWTQLTSHPARLHLSGCKESMEEDFHNGKVCTLAFYFLKL